MSVELVRYDAACRAVAECARIDEAAEIRDKAAALAAYAKQRDDRELESWVSEIKLRACQRIGQLSSALDRAEGFKGNQHQVLPANGKKQALAEAGISTSTAQRYEELAGGREEQGQAVGFAAADHYFAEQRKNNEPSTMDGLRGAVREALREAFPNAQPRRRPQMPRETPVIRDDRFTEFRVAISGIMRIDFDADHLARRSREFPTLIKHHRAEAIGAVDRIKQYLKALDQGGGNGSA